MIRNHPDALAILAILILLPGFSILDSIGQHVRWSFPPEIHNEFRMERDRMQIERDRFRDELHRAFRFRSL